MLTEIKALMVKYIYTEVYKNSGLKLLLNKTLSCFQMNCIIMSHTCKDNAWYSLGRVCDHVNLVTTSINAVHTSAKGLMVLPGRNVTLLNNHNLYKMFVVINCAVRYLHA